MNCRIQLKILTKRKCKDNDWHQEEHANKVDNGKPSVLSSDFAKGFAHWDWEPHERNWVEEKDAEDVEEQMHESHLWKKINYGQIQILNDLAINRSPLITS